MICLMQGVMEDAKPEVWPYLLGVFAPDMSTNERQLKLSCIRIEFGALMEACKVSTRSASKQEMGVSTCLCTHCFYSVECPERSQVLMPRPTPITSTLSFTAQMLYAGGRGSDPVSHRSPAGCSTAAATAAATTAAEWRPGAAAETDNVSVGSLMCGCVVWVIVGGWAGCTSAEKDNVSVWRVCGCGCGCRWMLGGCVRAHTY